MAKRKEKPNHTFAMRFKSKKNKSHIIKVESRFVKVKDNMLTIFPIISKREIIKCGENMTPAVAAEKIKMRVDVRNMNLWDSQNLHSSTGTAARHCPSSVVLPRCRCRCRLSVSICPYRVKL